LWSPFESHISNGDFEKQKDEKKKKKKKEKKRPREKMNHFSHFIKIDFKIGKK